MRDLYVKSVKCSLIIPFDIEELRLHSTQTIIVRVRFPSPVFSLKTLHAKKKFKLVVNFINEIISSVCLFAFFLFQKKCKHYNTFNRKEELFDKEKFTSRHDQINACVVVFGL